MSAVGMDIDVDSEIAAAMLFNDDTPESIPLDRLRAMKNELVGNPSAKAQFALTNVSDIHGVVQTINFPLEDEYDVREKCQIEAAHVLSSLSFGTPETAIVLLRAGAAEALLHALTNCSGSLHPAIVHGSSDEPESGPDPETTSLLRLVAALTRALTNVVTAAASIVSPYESGYGIGGLGPPPLKGDDIATARNIVKHIFEDDALDILLPLLALSPPFSAPSSSPPSAIAHPLYIQIQDSMAALLSSSLRSASNRARVIAWLPANERAGTSISNGHDHHRGGGGGGGARGWEKPHDGEFGSERGGWVARSLVRAVKGGNLKTRKTALEALVALTRDQPGLAHALCMPISNHAHVVSHGMDPEDSQAPATLISTLCKSRDPDITLSACFCLVTIIRAIRIDADTTRNTYPHSRWLLEPPYTLVGVLNGVIGNTLQPATIRSRACFILSQLVVDDKTENLPRTAYLAGSVRAVASAMCELVPETNPVWLEDEEPAAKSQFLEAALTAAASLTLQVEDIRTAFLSHSVSPISGPPDRSQLLPIITHSLCHPAPGVRYAACQCVRALSRSVGVLRTAIGDDALLPDVLLKIIKSDEDNRVVLIALMGIANMVNDFAPTREVLIRSGVVNRLAELIRTGDEELTKNSIWVIRNALYHSTPSEIIHIMEELGWGIFSSLLVYPKARIREISSATITNMMSQPEGMNLVYRALPDLVWLFEQMMRPPPGDEDTENMTVNALKAISNFATHRQADVLANPPLLRTIRDSLLSPSVKIQHAAVLCVHHLVALPSQLSSQSMGWSPHREIREAEIDAALRGVVHAPISSMSPPTPVYSGARIMSLNMGDEPERRDVRQMAKEALKWIEKGSIGM